MTTSTHRALHPIAPQPDPRWNHVGGAWFCKGEHEKGAKCSAYAEELHCPFGVVGHGIEVERVDGTWFWSVPGGREA